jgi:ribosomal protein L24
VSTITNVEPKTGLIKCEGINLRKKYVKPTSEQERAELKEIEAAFHHSNVMHYSKTQEARSRIGHKLVEVAGRDKPFKVRFLVKTGEVIDAVPEAVGA